MSTPTVTAVPIMSSLSHTLSFTPNRPLRQQKHQLSPPRSYKSENSRLPHLSAAMNVTNHTSRRSHPYHTTTHAESSTDDLRTPPTPPHPQMQPLLPSLPSILEPPFAPSSAGRFTASTTAVSTTPYPANATTPTSNSFVTTTPFASSTSIDSLTSSSSSSSSPLYHCRWRHCFRKFHGPELLYQHLCDDHVGRHARGNLCLECHWEDCQTVTNKRDHITSHLRVHVPLTPLRCRICDKRYKRRQDLKKHERKHLERLELSSTQLAGSELSSIVHPLPGTVLPDTHHSRHTTATTAAYHHHPYATPSYPPSASSSATSLRSGSPVHRPLASPSMAPPPSLPPVNLHTISPHHNHSNTHRPSSSTSLPPPSHHHPSTLPALTLGKSASPPSPFAASHNNGVRGGGNFTSQQTTYGYPSQSPYNISPPSSSTYTSTVPPHSYSYSSQPSHPPMVSNSPPATAPLSRFHHSQPPLHLPLPTTSHVSGYRQPQPTSMEEC